MDLETISTVLAVARTNSFSAASYIIPCAQSTVSRRVIAAESELNVDLFIRPADSADNTLQLTSAGKRIIPIMEKILEDYRELFSVASEAGLAQHTLRVGFLRNIMPPMAFSALKAELYEQYPNIIIELRFDRMENLLSDLKSRRLDVVVFSCLSLNQKECPLVEQFDLRVLGTVGLSIGISEHNPLAQKSVVDWSDLRSQIFFLNAVCTDQVAGVEFFDDGRFIKAMKEEFQITPGIQLLSDQMLEVRYLLAKNNKGVFLSYTPWRWRSILGIAYLELSNIQSHRMMYCMLSQKNRKSAELDIFSRFFASSMEKSEIPADKTN